MHGSLIFRGVTAATLAACACTGPGTNIPREDRVFASSLQRYQRTRILVDRDAAAASEAPMFMIAKGLQWRADWPLLVSAVAGVVVLNVDYTVSYEHAIQAVVQSNEREQRLFEARHPEAP